MTEEYKIITKRLENGKISPTFFKDGEVINLSNNFCEHYVLAQYAERHAEDLSKNKKISRMETTLFREE